MSEEAAVRLWDDNPTDTDLLGIDTVVEAVAAALVSPALNPVTVSMQSRWGGGKSSVLRMLANRFEDDPRIVVITVDPWEFEDGEDVRGTVISEVLTALSAEHPDSLGKKVGKLLKRVAWKRVGMTVARSALTMSMNPLELVDAFTPQPEEPKGMAGFRDEFEAVMAEATEIEKVVVLVDDLDRCNPATVVATLEAIKVFLAVPKLAFVLAAEEEMIRWSIAQDTHGGGRSEFADRYLEKIVQLPVTLPRLTQDAAETYVTLLLSQYRCGDKEKPAFDALVAHVGKRRAAGTFPLLGGPFDQGAHEPDARDLRMAALVAKGLSSDQWSSPRAIKRFLNAWGVREAIAQARRLAIEPDISLKLFVLEQRFAEDFKVLEQVAATERSELVRAWEAWGRSEPGAERPEQVSEGTRDWAGSEPSIVGSMEAFDRYINLAASFTSFSAGSGLSDSDLALLAGLAHGSEIERRQSVEAVGALDAPSRLAILERLLTRLPATEEPGGSLESACALAKGDPALVAALCEGVRRYAIPRLDVGDVIEISRQLHTQEVLDLLRDIVTDPRAEKAVQITAQEEIDGWTSR